MNGQALSHLLNACGLSDPLEITLISGDHSPPVRQTISQPFAVVGRAPQADVCLVGEQISWRHAYLQWIGGCLYCVDLQSRTGTHWQQSSRPSGWVPPGEALHIGPYALTVQGTPHPVLPESLGQLDPLAGDSAGKGFPPASLEFVDASIRGSSERFWPLNRLLTLVGQ